MSFFAVSSASAIECQGLTLEYRGGAVVGPLTFSVPAGGCVAVAGPNGAGKTSLLSMLLGLRPPTRGQALLFGVNTASPSSRISVGYLPETVDFPARSRADGLLKLHASLAGREDFHSRREIEAYLTDFGLEKINKSCGAYSKGMKQRLGLAISMLDCDRLLILDEPNSGLDPVGIALLRKKLLDLKAKGVTLLLSTHRLAEIMNLADGILVMNNGRIVAQENMTRFPDFEALEGFFLDAIANTSTTMGPEP